MKFLFLLMMSLSMVMQVNAQNTKLKNEQQLFSKLQKTKTAANGTKVSGSNLDGKFIILSFDDLANQTGSYVSKILFVLQSKNDNVKVIKVSQGKGEFDRLKIDWKKNALNGDNKNFISLLDNESQSDFSAVKAYNITEFPTTLLLDPSGKILSRYTGNSMKASGEMFQGISKSLLSGNLAQDLDDIKAAAQLSKKFFDLQEKELIISEMDSSNSYFPKLKSKMMGYLMETYGKLNESKKAQAILDAIPDASVKLEATVSYARILRDQKDTHSSLRLIQPLMDEIRYSTVEGKLKLEQINVYSKLVELYCQLVPVRGNEQDYIQYLKPIYETCNFFPGDAFSRSNQAAPAKNTLLVYHYATALASVANTKMIAEVLASYLHSEPESRTSEFLADFKSVDGLRGQLAAIKTKGNQRNYQNLYKLALKPDINGKVWGLHGLNSKYILLDFWGSWCTPCRASHPHLIEVYQKYKNKGLEMIGISYETSEDMNINVFNWKNAVVKDKITWIQLLNQENNTQFNAFDAFSDDNPLVDKFIYDMEGNFLGRFAGKDAAGLDKKLAELFPE